MNRARGCRDRDRRGAAAAAGGLVGALVVLALGACGGGGTTGTGGADVAARMQYAGIARDLVYVTDVDGFDLAVQSVGVSGDEGMSAAYVSPAGTVLLRTSRAAGEQAPACAQLEDDGVGASCEVVADGVHVLLEGDGVDAATLRAAGGAVRPARDGELATLFSELPTPPEGEPVERGDLPGGDGAPDNDPGPGG